MGEAPRFILGSPNSKRKEGVTSDQVIITKSKNDYFLFSKTKLALGWV